ncbi:KamA family radical SAM protein [Desulfosarcina ovata]|nr:lysine 2,3-aminomutase [Desulfosarcina ovata]
MKYIPFTRKNYHKIEQIKKLKKTAISDIDVVSRVFPFKTNNYVVNELIDWDNVEHDPLYMINFPQKELISQKNFDLVSSMLKNGTDKSLISRTIRKIRLGLNPHPAGQLECNIPELDGSRVDGIQHKYRETVLLFPAQGQTCHAYCTFCFRWPQFVGMSDHKIALKQAELSASYLSKHPEVTDVLLTGGDPMVMKAERLETYIDVLLNSGISNLKTIRIGTKSLSFWPYRFLTDRDSDKILELFRKVVDSGVHLSIMAHINHHREMKTVAFREAVKRIRRTGALIRSQSPILNHVNAIPAVWKKMWEDQVNMGIIPYYMFVPRNTGSHRFFSIPLVDAYRIFRKAFSNVSGMARTVRGPSMSARHGKIKIDGIPEINGKKYIAMSIIQGRSANWVKKPFFAEFDESARWIDELRPAFGVKTFFFVGDKESGFRISDDFDDAAATDPVGLRQSDNESPFLDWANQYA